ncbi:MAG: T9SS type A sorting domain-containing protein, partial [Phaeodactylibacter sp.]|nr:T9SS type A sorting domain-containing protein [Phaeodactylibacter sp.]
VIPYGILSKWHFDLYQSWCLFADEGAQERNLADGKILDVREYNYLYTDIDVSNFPGRLESVEFLTMEGVVALRVDELRPVDGVLQIPTQELDRGGYVLRMTDERGHEFFAVTQLREAIPLTHPEYNPLSQDASTGVYTLDLSLLQERIDNITIYNAAQEPALVLDAAGDLRQYEFRTDGLRAGQYLVEVQTARNSYFLPLEQRPSELAAAGFEVYPNPTSGALNIDLPADVRIEQAAIYDLQGRAVWTARTFRDRSIQLRLEPGAYQLQIRLANGRQYTERILVQRR